MLEDTTDMKLKTAPQQNRDAKNVSTEIKDIFYVASGNFMLIILS
jgi:hypothetical protein